MCVGSSGGGHPAVVDELSLPCSKLTLATGKFWLCGFVLALHCPAFLYTQPITWSLPCLCAVFFPLHKGKHTDILYLDLQTVQTEENCLLLGYEEWNQAAYFAPVPSGPQTLSRIQVLNSEAAPIKQPVSGRCEGVKESLIFLTPFWVKERSNHTPTPSMQTKAPNGICQRGAGSPRRPTGSSCPAFSELRGKGFPGTQAQLLPSTYHLRTFN